MEGQLDCLDLRTFIIFEELCKKGPLTKKELQETMNLKLTTLNREMNVLAEKKMIVSLGEAESTGGRKAVTYDVVHQDLYLAGVDLSRGYVNVVLTNLKLTVLKNEYFLLRSQATEEETIDHMIDLIRGMLQEKDITPSQIVGIGVGTVGPLDRERGIMVNPRGFLSHNWGRLSIKKRIEDKLSVPCVIDNGANAAALLEHLFGVGKNKGSVAYIQCGHGIRSAVIKNGSVLRTMNDHEDAFGSMAMFINREDKKSVEDVSALGAILQAVNDELKLSRAPLTAENYRHMLDTALKGNAAVEKIIREKAGLFSVGLSNFSRLLSPDVIILNGPVIMNLKNYFEDCTRCFYRNYPYADAVLFSKGGAFQENTIAIGSAAMVISHSLRGMNPAIDGKERD